MEFRALAEGRRLQRPVTESVLASLDSVGIGDDEDARLEQVRADGLDCAGSRLAPLDLVDVAFTGADLSNARWDRVVARRAEFVRCRGIGWRLGFELARDVALEDCVLDYAALYIERPRGPVLFQRCSLREATIGGDLSGVVFEDCELSGAEFDPIAAEGCDLRGSRLAGARGLLRLRGAVLGADQAVEVAATLAAEAGLVVR